jgi:hypothetical protein
MIGDVFAFRCQDRQGKVIAAKVAVGKITRLTDGTYRCEGTRPGIGDDFPTVAWYVGPGGVEATT